MLNYKHIGKQIRRFRKQRGFTQEYLGLIINTSGAYISNIERGVKKPSLENVAAIAEALGITVDNILSPPQDDYLAELETLIIHCSSDTRIKLKTSLSNIINILEQND